MSYDRVGGGGGGGGNGGFPPRGQSAQQPTSPQGRTQNPFNDSQQYLAYDHHMPAHQGYTGEERFNSPSPVLPPFRNNSHGRSPSPHNAQSYQLEENPYHADEHSPLQIPMGPGPRMGTPGDRLEMQPTYSVTNVHNSFGHNEAYDASHPYEQQAGHEQPYHQQHMPAAGDYSFNPQDHHDGYYDRPYQPTPASEYPPGGEYHNDGYEDDMGTRPILQNGAYGPDPHSAPNGEPDPSYGGGYMDANGEKRTTPPPAPIKRWKTVKEVKLFNGNLVLDCPVPPRLLNQITHAPPPGRDEFTHMRYSAATCDPKDFFNNRFTLRQRLFAKPRHTELFICVTMYNEDEELFARTMVGVMKNIEHMNSRTSSKTWGKDAWKKIVVCIVSDGRAKINPRTRAVLAAMGVYQEGIAKQEVNKQPVTAHVYEYTTQMALDIKQGVVQVRKGNTPVQMLFCLKEKNQKKINSHRWFFQAFGNVLEPNICVLIDAGTRPGRDSIYKLWKAFDLEPMCAGACGEIKAMLNKGKTLINPLVAAQNFEYKTSNILDKPLESVFGFITVLPGAFSAYRYVALQNDKSGAGPLEKYFKGELMHGADAGIFTANMYLAEDRILCFELIAKRNCHWILQYVKSATGETDVPTEMSDFILQRRRWLNGSFFAAVYALTHFYQVFGSAHSFLRKFMFLIEFLYQTVNMIFAWFAIGNFFLVFRILTTSLGSDDLLGRGGQIVAVIMEWFYLVTLVSCFVLSLGNRPQGSSKFYMTMVYFWACLMIYLMFAAVYITVHSIQEQIRTETHFSVGLLFSNNLFFTLIVSMASTYLLWFLMALLFFDPWHMFTSYLLLTPTYVNILNVYAFCNTHDVTWGTKGDTKPPPLPSAAVKPTGGVDVDLPNNDVDLNSQYEAELLSFARKAAPEKKILTREDKQEDYYKGFRSAVVLVWIFCNLALAAIVLNTSGFDRLDVTSGSQEVTEQQRATIYMQVVLWSVAALSAFRFVGSTWFLITRLIRGV